MSTNETVIITETSSDQTGATVVEVTTIQSDLASASLTHDTVVEEIIEALADDAPDALVETDQEYVIVEAADAGDDTPEPVTETPFESGADATSFVASAPDLSADDLSSLAPVESSVTVGTAATDEAESAEAAAAEAEQATHVASATEAQQAADDFVASGDYAAAAEAREVAENAAWEAGDSSLLHGSDATELGIAAGQQSDAAYYEQQQAEHAAAGDYEAARDDASNAAFAMGNADFNAGGDDHTGQALAEQNQMDWAVWEEGNAAYDANSAEYFAAAGNTEVAAEYAESAAEHQAAADYHGDLGEHDGSMAVYDSSAEVETGGTYDMPDTSYAAADYSSASSYDHSATDYSSE